MTLSYLSRRITVTSKQELKTSGTHWEIRAKLLWLRCIPTSLHRRIPTRHVVLYCVRKNLHKQVGFFLLLEALLRVHLCFLQACKQGWRQPAIALPKFSKTFLVAACHGRIQTPTAETLFPPVQRASNNRDTPLDKVHSIAVTAFLPFWNTFWQRALGMWRDALSHHRRKMKADVSRLIPRKHTETSVAFSVGTTRYNHFASPKYHLLAALLLFTQNQTMCDGRIFSQGGDISGFFQR